MPETLSGARRFGYALGGTGFQISDRIVVAIALYYYLPPGGRGLVPQVSQEVFLGGLTLYGAAMLVGRLFDALADPLVGHASDRSRSALGRRRSFMIWGVVPMLGIPILLFYPPGDPGSILNAYWLAGCLSAYFIAFTVYVAPYLALLPEVASDPDDRTRLSTYLGVVSFPVVMLFGAAWAAGIDVGRAAGLSSQDSIRAIVWIASIIGFLLCLAPILAIDEDRFTTAQPSELSMGQAVRATIGDGAFRIYLAAQLFFILSVNLIGPSLVYYATVVLGRSEGFTGIMGLLMLLSVGAGFLMMPRLARRLGPKRTIVGCNLICALSLASLWALHADAPGGPHDASNLAIICTSLLLLGLPIAGFLVMPFVLIGQMVDADAARTGANRAAMYFGIQGLITKGMYGVSSALLAYLFAAYGNSPEEPLGVLLIGPVAAVSCLVSTLIFLAYPERRVLAEIAGASGTRA